MHFYINFRYFTKAYPKDEFNSNKKLMIDNVSWHVLYSLINGSFRYNQIKITLKEQKYATMKYL